MGFEPDRDRFFQYGTFVMVGLTLVVCACYALLFFNPRINPIAGLRPAAPTADLSVASLPPTWTPTPMPTATETPPFTPTFTPTSTPTNTPTETLTPTPLPTATIFYIVVPGATPTRRPPTRVPATRVPPTPVPLPTAAFDFHLGRAVDNSANCGSWQVNGTIYSDQSGSQKLNGLQVRIWANGAEQGTDISGSHGQGAGYWEWNFGRGTNADGYVAIVSGDGSQRSAQVPFVLTGDCNGPASVQHATIDFVGGQ